MVGSVEETGLEAVGTRFEAVIEVLVLMLENEGRLAELESVVGPTETSVVQAVEWIILVERLVKCRVH